MRHLASRFKAILPGRLILARIIPPLPMRASVTLTLAILASFLIHQRGAAQFYELETENLRLIHFGQAQSYLAEQTARSFENALDFHRHLFHYTPDEKTTVIIHDLEDYGNAGADVIPENRIVFGIAPFHYVFETAPANERLNSTMNHELVHIIAAGQSTGRDEVFRNVFFGKVSTSADDPVSMIYSYLTAPRRYSPRWYHEGIAVFLETWMAGGLGRSLGGYDEMVFRTLVREDRQLFDFVGLESSGTSVDFQAGVNSYLYGTRFIGYLGLKYGPEQVIAWTSRQPGSKGYFGAQFKEVFGLSLGEAWSEWIEWERAFQHANLQKIRENPVTPLRPVSERALGSVSRAFIDRETHTLYAAVNFPGQIARIAALDVRTGTLTRIGDVKGANLYSVASLAYDAASNTLFYTTDNTSWRDLHALDPTTGSSTLLLKDARIGDLAFNPVDRSIWGIRHDNGFSTIVRIPPPYKEWNHVYTWPFGKDLYDLAISPDGRHLIGSLADVTGRQTLIRMDTHQLLESDDVEHEVLFDFGVSNPESFVFSEDGTYLVGSSYYSGVSNLYRYDFETGRMSILTNTETGLFRPIPFSADSLLAFTYTADGFRPVMLASERVTRVGAIAFQGQEIVKAHPIVRNWLAGSPGAIDMEARTTHRGRYRPLANLGVSSIYPIVQGYKDYAAIGLRMNVSEPIGLHDLSLSASYSPAPGLPKDERLHASLSYQYLEWSVDAAYNGADFYDLFGPTKTSRKGYMVGAGYRRALLFDRPRTLDLSLRAAAYGGLERLPDAQNVVAPFSELYTASAGLAYRNLRASIGAVDYEKGVRWDLVGSGNLVSEHVYPRLSAGLHLGTPLPIDHSSLWLRTFAGYSFGDRENPFANYYFGGFGNNWVDRGEIKQFHAARSFPGLPLNAIGGTNFAKVLGEWQLPPIRFERAGLASFYLKWARVSLFGAGLASNLDRPSIRTEAFGGGAQIDFRIMMLSYLSTTLSVGYAVANVPDAGDKVHDEFMISLKIL